MQESDQAKLISILQPIDFTLLFNQFITLDEITIATKNIIEFNINNPTFFEYVQDVTGLVILGLLSLICGMIYI